MPRARYDRLVEAGIFGPEDRIELLDGLLVVRERIGCPPSRAAQGRTAGVSIVMPRARHIR
jgi:hypothetical protein